MDNRIVVRLTSGERHELDAKWPQSAGQRVIGPRAVEIVKFYFRRNDPSCNFRRAKGGADLIVVSAKNEPELTIEVKGTGAKHLAPNQIKVSSEESKRVLVEKLIPIYRITDVFGDSPNIYVLIHGRDFSLKHEARWAFVLAKNNPSRSLDDQAKRNDILRTGKESKYDALRTWLQKDRSTTVMLLFREAKQLLGFPLPLSATKHQAYWANQRDTQNRPWARAWTDAGYIVDGLRLGTDGWVRFRRQS